MATAWWANGIRFGCTACGKCCTRRIPSASAPLAESEIKGMADFLGMPVPRFEAQYIESSKLPFSPTSASASASTALARQLKVDAKSGQCLLLGSEKKCLVFGARPAACRTYPFWPENMASPYEWAREAVLCEGIDSPWAATSSSSSLSPAERSPLVEQEEVERELVLEELRASGALTEQDWNHQEAAEHLKVLQEAGMAELELDSWPAPRRVLYHESGLVVLETDGSESTATNSNSNHLKDRRDFEDDEWTTRSLHFEKSVGITQTEVRYSHRFEKFDHSRLGFGVHQAFLECLQVMAKDLQAVPGSDPTVVVLGGGGGALPMALSDAVARDRAASGPLSSIGKIAVVEMDEHVALIAKKFFGFQELSPGEAPSRGAPALTLHIEDAMDYFDLPARQEDVFAVFVDIAGSDLPRSSSGSASGRMLAPPACFLSSAFISAVVSAVLPSRGVIAWNILVSDDDEASALKKVADAIARGAVVDGKSVELKISALGPIRRSVGSAQWLLVTSTGNRPYLPKDAVIL